MPHDILRVIADFRAPSWAPWREFKRALEGRPSDDRALFARCTGRTTSYAAPVTEAYAIVGRRGGKSRFAAALAIEAAFLKPWPTLARGEWCTIAVVAADRAQARNVFQYIEGMIDAIPAFAQHVVAQSADAIETDRSTRVEVTTASARGTRGYSFGLVICDELAFWRSEDTVEPDAEILQAIRPGMATLPGSRLVCISSPYARRGSLWTAYKAHWGRDDSPMLIWKAPTDVMNATVPASVILAAYEADPIAANAEYDAEFRADIDAFVAREVVDACVVPGRQGLPPVCDRGYVAFVDPSGGSQDSMCLTVAHAEVEGERVVAVLDHVSERRPPFSPEETVREFCTVLRAYRCAAVVGDRYGGEWPREQFAKYGVAYECSELVKSDIYREVLPLMTSGRVQLLDHARLLAQFLGLERRTSRAGRDSIDHGPHQHDDLANSAAGAVVLAAGQAATDWFATPWAANVSAEPRQRALDDRELALMARDRDGVGGW